MQQVRKLFSQHQLFLLFFTLAVLLRVLLLIWTLPSHENADLLRYEDWGRIAHIYGLADTYTTKHLQEGKTANNQPPGSTYITSAMFEVYSQEVKLVSKATHTLPGTFLVLDRNLINVTFKLPSLVADVVMGILAYILVKKRSSQKLGLLAASFIWFNPVIFYNSILWGQMDSINNFLFYCSLFFLIDKRLFLSMFFFSLSLLVKLSLLPLLPFYFSLLFLQFPYKKIFSYTVLCIAGSIAATFPISQTNPLWLVHFILSSSGGEGPNVTIFAYNFWWVVLHPSLAGYTPNSFNPFIFFSYDVWGYGLFTVFSIPILWLMYIKRKKIFTPSVLFGLFSTIILLVFLFLPRMHERYLFPFFPLFATYTALQKKYFLLFFTFILLHLCNLYVVWHPYPLPFPDHLLYTTLFAWLASIGIVLGGLEVYKHAITDLVGEDKKAFISLSKLLKLPNLWRQT